MGNWSQRFVLRHRDLPRVPRDRELKPHVPLECLGPPMQRDLVNLAQAIPVASAHTFRARPRQDSSFLSRKTFPAVTIVSQPVRFPRRIMPSPDAPSSPSDRLRAGPEQPSKF